MEYDQSKRYLGWEGEGISKGVESGQSQYGLHFKKTQNVTERFLGYGEAFFASH